MRRRHRQVLAQPFEHGLAQQAVIGQRAVFDLGVHDRFYPGGLGLLHRHRERRRPHDQRIEPLAQLARDLLGVAGAGLAGVEQRPPSRRPT